MSISAKKELVRKVVNNLALAGYFIHINSNPSSVDAEEVINTVFQGGWTTLGVVNAAAVLQGSIWVKDDNGPLDELIVEYHHSLEEYIPKV